jgi:hypothetical protein
MLRHHLIPPFLMLGVCLATPAVAAPAAEPAVIEGEANAKVRFHRVMPWKPIRYSKRIRVGEHLTCAAGCRVQLADGTTVTLSPGAEVAGASPTFKRFDGAAMAQRTLVFRVVEGDVAIERPAQPKPLVIETAAGVLLHVPRDAARVLARSNRVAVVTSEAASQYRRGRHWVDLPPEKLHVVHSSLSADSLPIITPPAWKVGSEHRPLGLAVAGPRANVGGAWKAMAGAAGYVVEVARDAGFMEMVERKELAGTANRFTTNLSEGRYYARVTATDREGMISATSSSMQLRVVRASLPEGAFMPDDGTIVVPRDARVRLLDAKDVELSVGKHGFNRAPAELPAAKDSARSIRLRVRGAQGSATRFQLQLRALHAHVSMTPRVAAWPSDRIRATVRIADPSGHIDPSTVTPALEVRVAGAPVMARWEREGATWRTWIDGRYLDGPSLVEVVARDAQGKKLGWGFVEVQSHRR